MSVLKVVFMKTLTRTGGHKMAALKVAFMTTLIQTGGHKMDYSRSRL